MKKLGFLLLTLCLRFSASGQVNLVPNGGFEYITNCPYGTGAIYKAPPWFQPATWQGNTSNSSSSDLYDTCGNQFSMGIPTNFLGYQPARTGHGYAGIFLHIDTFNYGEYIEVPLLSALLANKKYCVQFYISLADSSTEAISNIGAFFSTDSLLDFSILQHPSIVNVIPQIENPTTNILSDTVNWTLVSGDFIASGGEKFMTIGNFHTPANTNSINVAIPSSGGLIPSAYYYIDDVSVIYCDPSGISEINNQPSTIEISPNPATSEITITSTKAIIKEAHIYTMMGQCIHQSAINNRQSTIDISALPAGMYIAEVISENGVIRKRFVKQ
jgi:OmpA-OmpF porin, OOP family